MKMRILLPFLITAPLLSGCSNVEEIDYTFLIAERDIKPTQQLVYEEYEDGYEVLMRDNQFVSKVVIPETYNNKPVIRIADEGFVNAKVLSMLHMPKTIKSIGKEAFKGCKQLRMLNIPESVTSIESDALKDLTSCGIVVNKDNLNDIYTDKIDGSNYLTFNSFDYVWNDDYLIALKKEDATLVRVLRPMEKYSLPTTINYYDAKYNLTTLGARSIYTAQSKLLEINLSPTILRIEQYTFLNCKLLTNIHISSNVSDIEDYAFKGCESLKIYCDASSKPEGWKDKWNVDNCEVIWKE